MRPTADLGKEGEDLDAPRRGLLEEDDVDRKDNVDEEGRHNHPSKHPVALDAAILKGRSRRNGRKGGGGLWEQQNTSEHHGNIESNSGHHRTHPAYLPLNGVANALAAKESPAVVGAVVAALAAVAGRTLLERHNEGKTGGGGALGGLVDAV